MSTNYSKNPIGIFDSGIGGLSVLHEMRNQLPQENFIYIADSAFAPYGEKTAQQIIRRCFELTDLLLQQQVKMLVVACNTATAFAVNALRDKYELPIVAMEPAVKPAVENSHCGKVGILATTMTLASDRYASLLERFASQTNVVEQACPGLVEQIEKLELDCEKTNRLLHEYLDPLLKQKVDAIVLGCTHYPLLKQQIESITQNRINVIDTAKAVTAEIKRRLLQQHLLNDSDDDGQIVFFSSGELTLFEDQLNCFWPDYAVALPLDRIKIAE